MASEAHNDRKRNLLHIEGCPIDLPRKRISYSPNKNMKKSKKSSKQLASYTNRTTVGQTLTSPCSLFKVVYCKRKVQHHSPKPCYRKNQFPKVRNCEMANKENELACAGNLPAKLHNDSRTLLLNPSDSGTSQTEGPSSKYSGFFSEVSQDHETMAQVLFSRNLRLNVALTFWRRRSISELVAYLLRIQDLGVIVDCLPVLTSSLQEEKPYISVGCCVDLLTLVKLLLKSKYEENIQILKEQLCGLWKQENHLTLVPGYTGSIAKLQPCEASQFHGCEICCFAASKHLNLVAFRCPTGTCLLAAVF
uniref:Katanin regulatory subunit B1 like 1 n=1 Tax=Crocodylus porosus TaxID=8502 RepID=A0A7M4FLY4_CROPO